MMNISWLKKWMGSSSPGNDLLTEPLNEFIPIEMDMMLKGNYFDRPTGKVRQCSVTINGSTLLVTSGDKVDRKTYEALLDFKAIKAVSTNSETHKETE